MRTKKAKKLAALFVALVMVVTAIPFSGITAFADDGEQTGTADTGVTVDFTDAQTCDFVTEVELAYGTTFSFVGSYNGESVEMTATVVKVSAENEFSFDTASGIYTCDVYGWVMYSCEYLPEGSEEPLVKTYKIHSLENHMLAFGQINEEDVVFSVGDVYMVSFGYYTEDSSDGSQVWNEVAWVEITFEFENGEDEIVQALDGRFYALSSGSAVATAKYTIPGASEESVIKFSFTVESSADDSGTDGGTLLVDFKDVEVMSMSYSTSVEPGEKVYFDFKYDTTALTQDDFTVSIVAGDATLEQADDGTMYVQTHTSEVVELVAFYTKDDSTRLRANMQIYAPSPIYVYLDDGTTIDVDLLEYATTNIYVLSPVGDGTYENVNFSPDAVTFEGDNPDYISALFPVGIMVYGSCTGTLKIAVSETVTVTLNVTTHNYFAFGDINEDTVAGTIDLMWLFDFVSSRGENVASGNIYTKGDLNGDSEITLADVIILKLVLEGRYSSSK